MARTKGKLSNVTLDEISFVGKGDNPKANIVLMKSKQSKFAACSKDFDVDTEKNDMIKEWVASNPDKVSKEDGAMTFDEIVQDREIRDIVWNKIWLLESSISSIIDDDDVEDKVTLITRSVEEFKTAITAITKRKGDTTMPEELKKQLDAAQEKVTSLEKTNGELATEVEALKAKTGVDEAGTCKSCGAKLKREAEIDKSALPESIQKHMEKLEKENEDNRKAIEKMADAELTRTYVAKAASVCSVGKTDELADLLKSIAKVDATIADKVFDVIKSADARIREGGLFKEAGANDTTNAGASAYDKIVEKAKELRKSQANLTEAQAFTQVYESDTVLREAYMSERTTR